MWEADISYIWTGEDWLYRQYSAVCLRPTAMPKWSSVYLQFHRWTLAGPWKDILDALDHAGIAPDKLQIVDSVTALTPRMRRLRLSVSELLRFDSMTALHCKLMFPREVGETSWPSLNAQGRFLPGNALIRKYTIRALDVAAGWMDIDFVIHHPAGPGSDWAARARPGDRLELIGPGGGGIRSVAPLLLLGDETALSAIARTLEALPPGQVARAFVEIADLAERQPLTLPAGARPTWLPRDGRPHGEALVQALKDSAPDPDTLVWAGCEFAAFRAIRSHLRGPRRHPRERHLITAYWRKGVAAPTKARQRAIAGLTQPPIGSAVAKARQLQGRLYALYPERVGQEGRGRWRQACGHPNRYGREDESAGAGEP